LAWPGQIDAFGTVVLGGMTGLTGPWLDQDAIGTGVLGRKKERENLPIEWT
jgi:hypothetical protein